MNVEQLAAIATQFQADLGRTNLVSVLNNLVSAFNSLLENNTEEHQIAFNSAREALNDLLEDAKPFSFPKTWRHNLEQLGIEEIVGEGLFDLINNIIDKNVLTPVIARDQLTQIQVLINEINQAFTNILSGFEWFKIEPAMLMPGDAELSVLIPQSEIDSDLESFAKEVATFQKTITIISE